MTGLEAVVAAMISVSASPPEWMDDSIEDLISRVRNEGSHMRCRAWEGETYKWHRTDVELDGEVYDDVTVLYSQRDNGSSVGVVLFDESVEESDARLYVLLDEDDGGADGVVDESYEEDLGFMDKMKIGAIRSRGGDCAAAEHFTGKLEDNPTNHQQEIYESLVSKLSR